MQDDWEELQMIYTVTFNPALDYVVRVEHVTLGAVNRTVEEHIFYGGKGINVSAVLANLGMTARLWDLWRALRGMRLRGE